MPLGCLRHPTTDASRNKVMAAASVDAFPLLRTLAMSAERADGERGSIAVHSHRVCPLLSGKNLRRGLARHRSAARRMPGRAKCWRPPGGAASQPLDEPVLLATAQETPPSTKPP